MRAYIITDMVGCCGIWRSRQCKVGTLEWRRARTQVTLDVNAAIEGLKRLGYPEIYIKDLHGTGNNLKRGMLLPGVRYEPGIHIEPIPIFGPMRWGNCAVLIGFHAAAGTEEAFEAFTLKEVVEEIRVNDQQVSEAHLVAGLLGELDINVNFISGDQPTVDHFVKLAPWAEGLVVPKDMQTRTSEISGGAGAIRKRNEIRSTVEKCCNPKYPAKPLRFERPVEMSVIFKTERDAEVHNTWGLKQIDRRIHWTSVDFMSAMDQLMRVLYVPRSMQGVANTFFSVSNFVNRNFYRLF